jgi:hypothetical protein
MSPEVAAAAALGEPEYVLVSFLPDIFQILVDEQTHTAIFGGGVGESFGPCTSFPTDYIWGCSYVLKTGPRKGRYCWKPCVRGHSADDTRTHRGDCRCVEHSRNISGDDDDDEDDNASEPAGLARCTR